MLLQQGIYLYNVRCTMYVVQYIIQIEIYNNINSTKKKKFIHTPVSM